MEHPTQCYTKIRLTISKIVLYPMYTQGRSTKCTIVSMYYVEIWETIDTSYAFYLNHKNCWNQVSLIEFNHLQLLPKETLKFRLGELLKKQNFYTYKRTTPLPPSSVNPNKIHNQREATSKSLPCVALMSTEPYLFSGFDSLSARCNENCQVVVGMTSPSTLEMHQ